MRSGVRDERRRSLTHCCSSVVWTLWPDSEQEIYDRADTIMDSDDPKDWFDAKPDVETLLRRFPDGPYAEKAQGWMDLIEAERLVNRIKTRIRLGHDPENELERAYRRALSYEELGHNATALAIFEEMQEDLAEASVERIFGGRSGDPLIDRIFKGLLDAGSEGLSRKSISSYLGGHVPSGEISAALDTLRRRGLVRTWKVPGEGRPTEMWAVKEAKEAN